MLEFLQKMTYENIQAAGTVSAIILSCTSIYLIRKNWRDSNRPIVCAYIKEDSVDAGIALFNFCLLNSGSRPAINIKLKISDIELEKMIDEKAKTAVKESIADLFDENNIIPILVNGEVITAGLGYSCLPGINEPQLKYGALAKLTIKYEDLEGKLYSSKQPIRVYPRSGFNGVGVWESQIRKTCELRC